jgi:hypothetical protein
MDSVKGSSSVTRVPHRASRSERKRARDEGHLHEMGEYLRLMGERLRQLGE